MTFEEGGERFWQKMKIGFHNLCGSGWFIWWCAIERSVIEVVWKEMVRFVNQLRPSISFDNWCKSCLIDAFPCYLKAFHFSWKYAAYCTKQDVGKLGVMLTHLDTNKWKFVVSTCMWMHLFFSRMHVACLRQEGVLKWSMLTHFVATNLVISAL